MSDTVWIALTIIAVTLTVLCLIRLFAGKRIAFFFDITQFFGKGSKGTPPPW